MAVRCWLIPAASALALGFVAIPAEAAIPATGGLGIAISHTTGVEQAHYRYRYHRRRHYYRHYRHVPFYFYYGPRHHHRRYWRRRHW